MNEIATLIASYLFKKDEVVAGSMHVITISVVNLSQNIGNSNICNIIDTSFNF